jgi:Zn-dependent protease with chaperone function
MAEGGGQHEDGRGPRAAARPPTDVRLRLLALALLGHGVVVGVLVLVLAPFVLVAAHLLGGGALGPEHAYVLVLPAAVAAVVVRTLWVRFEPPQGHRLAPGEAPALQAEVERLRRAMGAPPLEGIVIDGDLNARAASLPRALGLLGHRHVLVLGLPLLRILDRERLAAVIAHEFGHFTADDGRFAAWVHLSRGTWYRLRDGLGAHGFGFAWLLSRFYGWLAPRFDLASRALARAHEYAADAASARAVGAQAAADALATIELASRRLEARFWPRLWARARIQSHPPAQLQAPLLQAATSGGLDDVARLAAADAPQPAADPSDTHPTLLQRLQALDARPRARAAAEPAAAMLGDLEARLERRFDDAWRDAVRAQWQAGYEAAAADRRRLAALEALAAPTAAELAELARLSEQVRIDIDPLPAYERALAASPDHVPSLLRAGLLQLRGDDPAAGAVRLQRAVELDPRAARAALDALQALALGPGLAPEAIARIQALCATFAALAGPAPAAPEDGAAPADALQPHDLDADALRRLGARLACEPRVARAWIVRRTPALSGTPPHYLVLLDWRGSVVSEAAGLAQLEQSLALPGATLELSTGTHQARLARQVRRLCGEPVYRKGTR